MQLYPSTFLTPLLGGLTYDRLRALKTLGYWPNIREPGTFNEMLLHRKFFKPVPNAALLADKWRVRRFVKDRIGDDVLNEVLIVTDDPDKIDFDALPDVFVIKMNNASSRNVIVFDKREIDLPRIRAKLRRWLKAPFGHLTSETYYRDIKPLILVERVIGDAKQVPDDYKIHVFHGHAVYIEVHNDRFNADKIKHTARFYDRDWIAQSFTNGEPLADLIPRPSNLARLIELAERLAYDFDYVRVDLYIVAEQISFGELTLVPAAGHAPFVPRAIDFELGALWRKTWK